VLRSHLRAAGVTYKMLAERIDMSESSVKRTVRPMASLSRLAQICKAAGVAMEDGAARRGRRHAAGRYASR
jgi:hypothetical protein